VIHKIQPLHGHLVHQAANVLIQLENKNPAIDLYSYNCMTKIILEMGGERALKAQCYAKKKVN